MPIRQAFQAKFVDREWRHGDLVPLSTSMVSEQYWGEVQANIRSLLSPIAAHYLHASPSTTEAASEPVVVPPLKHPREDIEYGKETDCGPDGTTARNNRSKQPKVQEQRINRISSTPPLNTLLRTPSMGPSSRRSSESRAPSLHVSLLKKQMLTRRILPPNNASIIQQPPSGQSPPSLPFSNDVYATNEHSQLHRSYHTSSEFIAQSSLQPQLLSPQMPFPSSNPSSSMHNAASNPVDHRQSAEEPVLEVFITFIEEHGGKYNEQHRSVSIRITDPCTVRQLYTFLEETDYIQGLTIILDFEWTQQDLELLEDAIKKSKVVFLTVDGCNVPSENTNINKIKDRRAWSTLTGAGGYDRITTHCRLGTRFDPIIRLLGTRTLRRLHLFNMPECLREFSGDLPDDLSHLDVLQVQISIGSWSGAFGARLNDLIGRCTHLKRIILDCAPNRYRETLERVRFALLKSKPTPTRPMSPPAASTRGLQEKAVFPRQVPREIEVQFFTRGTTHIVARFSRNEAKLRTLMINPDAFEYEVLWHRILESRLMESVHTLRLDNLPGDDWMGWVISFLESRYWRPDYHNAKNPFLRLEELSLTFKNLNSAKESEFMKLLSVVTSPALSICRLRLLDLNMPLPAPEPSPIMSSTYEEEELRQGRALFPKGARGRYGWSRLLVGMPLWNVEHIELHNVNFKDRDIEHFVAFMQKLKNMSGDIGSGDRKLKMKLKQVIVLKHSLSKEGRASLVQMLKVIRPPVIVHI